MATADYYYPDCKIASLIFFCNSGLKNCWHRLPGIEPTTLDLSSESGAYDLSAEATPCLLLVQQSLVVLDLYYMYLA